MARVHETGKALEGDDRQTHKQIYGNYRYMYRYSVVTCNHSHSIKCKLKHKLLYQLPYTDDFSPNL